MLDYPLVHAGSDGWTRCGSVHGVSARAIQVRVPGLTPGVSVRIDRPNLPPIAAEVVEVCGDRATCVPLASATGVVAGARVSSTLARVGAFVGRSLLGCDGDAWGRCAGSVLARVADAQPLPLPASKRVAVNRALFTGVTAIDAFATLGHGQRIALFAGAGIGKTTILKRIVDGAHVDARVIALIGERGREASELMERFANDRRRSSTTIICATAETPPIERLAAARTATAHAEALAEEGADVLLVVDSLTRVATAWREHALTAGESATHRGHPPSLSSTLARLVERAGARNGGSVTGIYAVLVEGDDAREPVTDAVRALLDGHVALSRKLAESGRYPPVDVLRSLSRLMHDLAAPDHRRDAAIVRSAIAAPEDAEDLFAIGAYRPGGDARLDAAVRVRADLDALVFDNAIDASTRDPLAALAVVARRLREAT